MLKLNDLKVEYSSKVLENNFRLDLYKKNNAPI